MTSNPRCFGTYCTPTETVKEGDHCGPSPFAPNGPGVYTGAMMDELSEYIEALAVKVSILSCIGNQIRNSKFAF
jgi:hypothetical protein